MNKRTVFSDDLRTMILSPKKLPHLSELDTHLCWPPTVEDYREEYLERQLTRLRREKALLREALQEAVETAKRVNGFNLTYTSTRWEERILKLTEDK